MKDRYESIRRRDLGLAPVTRGNRHRGWHDAAEAEPNPILVLLSLVFVVAAMLILADHVMKKLPPTRPAQPASLSTSR